MSQIKNDLKIARERDNVDMICSYHASDIWANYSDPEEFIGTLIAEKERLTRKARIKFFKDNKRLLTASSMCLL